MPTIQQEVFISVDVETAGPCPSRYPMLSIGACLALDPRHSFYVELKPVGYEATPEAMAVHGLSLAHLEQHGLPPVEALERFAAWVADQTPAGSRPVFVAFNAPFDWMFVNDYFLRFLGRNPFGHTALDMKALYMGLTGVPWHETSMHYVVARYGHSRPLTHHALSDAQDQALLFRAMLAEAQAHGWGWV